MVNRISTTRCRQPKENVLSALCVCSNRKFATCKQEADSRKNHGGCRSRKCWSTLNCWSTKSDLILVMTFYFICIFHGLPFLCALWNLCNRKLQKRCVCVCVSKARRFIHYSVSDIKDVDVVRDICRRDTGNTRTQTSIAMHANMLLPNWNSANIFHCSAVWFLFLSTE